MDPSSRSTSTESKTCIICYDNIVAQPAHEGEKEKILDCSHIFHRECIGEWLKQKHNCPVCRAHVEVDTPEAPRPQMTIEEILAIPDSQISFAEALSSVRHTIQEIRHVRQLNLNENTQVANTARKVNALAGRIFGW